MFHRTYPLAKVSVTANQPIELQDSGLNGLHNPLHDTGIKEAARLTDERVELDEYSKDALNDRMQIIAERIAEQPEIVITYFQPDRMKNGGAYVTATNAVKKIDEHKRIVIMADGTTIPIDEIVSIEGAIFETCNDQ